jgi:predicted ester cyclase
MIDRNKKRQIRREKLLFRYYNALERGNFETVSDVLEAAQQDPILERMILEVHEVYLTELQSGQPFRPLDHRNNIMNISITAPRRRWNPPVTLAVAAAIALVFSVVLIYNAYRNSPIDFAGLFQSEEETNIATFLRYTEEAWNQGNVDMLAEVLTPDHVRHDNGTDYTGVDAVAELVTAFRTAMPDLHFDVQDITADGDSLWAYVTGSGTQSGPLSLPEGTLIMPSGTAVRLRAMSMARFADDKIAEIWVEYDNLGWMQQSGVVPSLQELTAQADNTLLIQRLFNEWWYGGNHDIVFDVYPPNGALSHHPYVQAASNMGPIAWRTVYEAI